MKKTKQYIRDSFKRTAIRLSKEGLTCREIAKHIPRSKTTIAEYIKDGQKLDKKTKKE